MPVIRQSATEASPSGQPGADISLSIENRRRGRAVFVEVGYNTCRGDTKQVMKSLSVKDGEGQTAAGDRG